MTRIGGYRPETVAKPPLGSFGIFYPSKFSRAAKKEKKGNGKNRALLTAQPTWSCARTVDHALTPAWIGPARQRRGRAALWLDTLV